MALEYVHGRSLTSYCDGGKLDITHRIGLVLQVLDAVQYAHSRLVIHRDLKPGNILVTEDAQVKLLDFGIAKLLADEKGESAEALTQVGAIAFTPDYASPEQVRGESLGTASDVYSLGVVLYELLCGHRPHKRGRNPAASLTPDPPQGPAAPSQRVDSATAPLRQLPPRELQRQLRGDLDTIVLKALKFDPAARYPTVVEFAADLRRFLAGEPVLARPDSLAYRAFKFSRRNRGLVASTLSAVTAVSVGLGVSLWQYRLKSIEAENARAEAKAAQAVQQFMQSIFSANSMDVEQPQDAGSTTARELLNHAAESASTQSMESPHARVKLLVMLGYLYMQVHELSRALKMAELALQTAATIDPEGLDMAESLGIYGVALDYSYRTDEAETVARQRLALLERLAQAGKIEQVPISAEMGMGDILLSRNPMAALPHLDRAIALARAQQNDTELMTGLLLRANAVNKGAIHDPLSALASAREALEVSSRLERTPERRGSGRAVAVYQEVAQALLDLDDPGEALRFSELAVQVAKTFPIRDAPLARWHAAHLARAYIRTAQPLKAIAMLEQDWQLANAAVPDPDVGEHALLLIAYQHAQVAAGRYEASLRTFDRFSAFAMRKPLQLTWPAKAHGARAIALLALGRVDEAEPSVRLVAEMGHRTGIDRDLMLRVHGLFELARHRPDAVLDLVASYRRGSRGHRTIREQCLEDTLLARAALMQGQFDKATSLAEQMLGRIRRHPERAAYDDLAQDAQALLAQARKAHDAHREAPSEVHQASMASGAPVRARSASVY